jgi:hypothetical protein
VLQTLRSTIQKEEEEIMVHIGFTGTRRGMTDGQKRRVRDLLMHHARRVDRLRNLCVHHGDCKGADADFHNIASSLRLHRTIHPPANDRLRAFCAGDVCLEPLPYRKRNTNILLACDLLVATPAQAHEINYSGTWATIREARRMGRAIIILEPTVDISNVLPAD